MKQSPLPSLPTSMPIGALGRGYSQHMGATQSIGPFEGRPLAPDPNSDDPIAVAARAAPDDRIPSAAGSESDSGQADAAVDRLAPAGPADTNRSVQMREGKAGQSQPGSSSMQPASAPDIPGKNSRSMGAAAVAELSPSGPDESRLTDAIAVDPKQDHEQEEEDAQQAYYTYYSTMGSEHPAVQPPSADTAAAADSAGSAAVPSAGAVADRTSSHALDDLHLGEDASSVGTAGEFGLRDEAQQTDDSDEVEEIILRGHAPTGAGSLAAVQTGMTAVQYSAVQSFAYSGEAGTSSAGGMVEVAVPACARLVSGALVGGKYASTGGSRRVHFAGLANARSRDSQALATAAQAAVCENAYVRIPIPAQQLEGLPQGARPVPYPVSTKKKSLGGLSYMGRGAAAAAEPAAAAGSGGMDSGAVGLPGGHVGVDVNVEGGLREPLLAASEHAEDRASPHVERAPRTVGVTGVPRRFRRARWVEGEAAFYVVLLLGGAAGASWFAWDRAKQPGPPSYILWAVPAGAAALLATSLAVYIILKLCTGDLHDAAVRRAEQRAIMRAHQRRPRMGGEGQGPAPRRRAPPAAFSGGGSAAGRPPVGAAPVAATGVVSGLAAGRMGSLHRSTSV